MLKRLCLSILLFLSFSSLDLTNQNVFAQTEPQTPVVKVATRLVSPFVVKEAEILTGFSIELWEALAKETGVKFEYVVSDTLPELFEAVKNGKADLAIAAISITAERENNFDFAQPMFDAGLQIMVSTDRSQGTSIITAMSTMFSSKAFRELLVLLAILIVLPLPIIWLVERKERHALIRANGVTEEIFKSFWWSASTLAGQATNMPYTFFGRIIAIIWMFTGVVFVSYFTANVTASLTVKQLETGINGPQDLVGKKVATVKGSTAAQFLQKQGIQSIELANIDDVYETLKDNRAAAIVYDSPILLYYASKEGKGKVQMAGPVFRPETYGILFPAGSPLRKTVNGALLKLRETGEYRKIYQRWFPADVSGG
jgi:polar amino acid transport system substrate-binding protein